MLDRVQRVAQRFEDLGASEVRVHGGHVLLRGGQGRGVGGGFALPKEGPEVGAEADDVEEGALGQRREDPLQGLLGLRDFLAAHGARAVHDEDKLRVVIHARRHAGHEGEHQGGDVAGPLHVEFGPVVELRPEHD